MAVNFDFIWAKYMLLKLRHILRIIMFIWNVIFLFCLILYNRKNANYTSITLLYVILNHFQNKSYMHQSQYMYFTKNILTNNHNRLKIDK